MRVEKKFIIELPDLIVLSNHHIISTMNLEQVFVENANQDGDCHVRCEEVNGVKQYYYSRKFFDYARNLRVIAEDYPITKEEYDYLIKNQILESTAVVKKTRFVFVYKEQVFNLDVFNAEGNPLAPGEGILMIEIPYPEEHLEFPRDIFLKQEISNNIKCTTKVLAEKLKKRG